ncbi:MAG: mobilization protein [Thiotrichales bacterium]
MNNIHFVGGEKGGVGKSVTSRVLAQYFIDKEQPLAVFDTDLSHGAMMRHYAEFSHPVDLSDVEQIDAIVELATGDDAPMILVDLAAQSSRPLFQWMLDADLPSMAQDIGLQLHYWHVMDDGKDSLNLLNEWLDQFPEDEMTLRLIKNHGRGKHFSALLETPIREKLAERSTAQLDLPELHKGTMHKIDRYDASFWAAVNNKDETLGPCLNLMERQRVKTWLNRFFGQLDSTLEQG